MKTFITGALALVLMTGVAAAGGGGKIKFEPGTKHEALLAEAKATGKAVMLYFTADF